MAVFRILRLNKMTCGNRRGLVDMDVQVDGILPELYMLPGTEVSKLDDYPHQRNAGIVTESNVDYEYERNVPLYDYPYANKLSAMQQENATTTTDNYILNEDQISIDVDTYNNHMSAHNGLNGSSAIQLTPEFWWNEYFKYIEVDEDNAHLSSFRVVYEFELDQLANSKAMLRSSTTQFIPLNDLLDVCVKSMFKKTKANYALPGNLMLDSNYMTYNKNVDQYFVFEDNPVHFCQFNGDAFLISQTMTSQPYRMTSNLKDQIESGQLNESHSFQLMQDEISTVLYPAASSYGESSYAAYLEKDSSRSSLRNVINMFTPARTITGINYNYVVEVEQNKNVNTQYDNKTIYDNGDIYGFFITAKNMYNALYSMEMSSSNAMQNCREYAGVQGMGGKLMLKFYDRCDYQIDSSSNASLLSADKYPYQKVETFDVVRFGHATRHKSNLFSLKITNSGLDDAALQNCTDEQLRIAKILKKSISNAMQHLADSIAPANTQLFATYFVENQ